MHFKYSSSLADSLAASKIGVLP